LCALSARAQRVRGELRLEVRDPHGTALSPSGELVSEANGVRRSFVGRRGATLRRIFHSEFTGWVCRRKDSRRGAIWLKFAPKCRYAWP
jgi:hypothetical protein